MSPSDSSASQLVTRFDKRDALFENAERAMTAAITESLAGSARASIALSGGSTPEPLYRRLAAAPLPWSRVATALVDERWVPLDDPDSNEAMIRRAMNAEAAGATIVTGLYTGDASPEVGLEEANRRYRALPQPFAVTVLGMGDDGHTASLFPNGQGLAEALAPGNEALVAAVRTPAVRSPRITLTLPAILSSRLILVLLTGERKMAVLEQALQPGPVEELPIRAVLRQTRTPVRVLWAG